MQTTVVVSKEADSWDGNQECGPASYLLPDESQLPDGQDLRATEVRGTPGSPRGGQVAKPDREVSRVDRLESHASGHREDGSTQESVQELVELGGPGNRPGGAGRGHDLLGRQFRPVVGEAVAVHADD